MSSLTCKQSTRSIELEAIETNVRSCKLTMLSLKFIDTKTKKPLTSGEIRAIARVLMRDRRDFGIIKFVQFKQRRLIILTEIKSKLEPADRKIKIDQLIERMKGSIEHTVSTRREILANGGQPSYVTPRNKRSNKRRKQQYYHARQLKAAPAIA